MSKKKKRIIVILSSILAVIVISIAGYYGYKVIDKSKGEVKKNELESLIKEKDINEVELKDDRSFYKLNVAFDEERGKIYGDEKVKFKNIYKDELKEVVFHLYPDSYRKKETMPSIGLRPRGVLSEENYGGIDIEKVSSKEEKLDFTAEKQVLKIPLKKSLKSGESIELNIKFALKIPNGTDRLGYKNGQYSVTNWYPILSIYDEQTKKFDETVFYPVGESNYANCSDYEVNVTVPKGVVVASSGNVEIKNKDKDYDIAYCKGENIRDFDFFMSKDYKVLSKTINGITVKSYYLKYKETGERMLDLAVESIEFFGKTFGKYPYKEYSVVETNLSGGAMEYPTITQMGLYKKLPSEYSNETRGFLDEAVVHETGHQWWYSTVGNNEFKDPVLDESFTAYSTALFFEKKLGDDDVYAVKHYVRTNKNPNDVIYRQSDKYNWMSLEIYVYKLGPAVLEDLRKKVGEEKFIEIFRAYYEKYKFKNANLDGFLEVIKEKAGQEASDYIKDEFTKPGYVNNN